jgi:hypothetical protein
MTHMTYPAELNLAYDIAYNTYVTVKNNWAQVSETCQNKLRRQIEGTLGEAGFRGTALNLWSRKRYESKINELNGIPPTKKSRSANEHPIPPRVIALHILSLPDVLSKEEYFEIWHDNYVYVETTNEENYMLKQFQKHMKFGDCWRTLYAAAGIELMDKPKLAKHADKIRHGVIVHSKKK